MRRGDGSARSGGTRRWGWVAITAGTLALVSGLSFVTLEGGSVAGPRKGSGVTRVSAVAVSASSHWVLTRDDEFNGKGGRPADWAYSRGGSGWAHKQLQYFLPKNAGLDGRGHLILTAKKSHNQYTCWYGSCKYTSARMQTEGLFSQKYGKFEARIKIPFGRGIWPAFWLEGSHSEIDVIETNSRSAHQVHSGAHAGKFNFTGVYHLKQRVSAGYHVFGVTWTPKGITWTIDGRAYSHLAAWSRWPFHQRLFMILEVAVGGPWPGSPNSTTRFPQHMRVDWIRVYRHVA